MVTTASVSASARVGQPLRMSRVSLRRRSFVSSGSRIKSSETKEAELKKMEEFRKGLGAKLEEASKAPSAAGNGNTASTDERDLPEVELDEYWNVVKDLSVDGQVLMIHFYTQWCGPCKLMKPTLCDWAEELEGKVSFRKFEASKKNAPVGKELGIKSVPTLIVYKDNEEVGRIVGNKIPALRELIDSAIN